MTGFVLLSTVRMLMEKKHGDSTEHGTFPQYARWSQFTYIFIFIPITSSPQISNMVTNLANVYIFSLYEWNIGLFFVLFPVTSIIKVFAARL